MTEIFSQISNHTICKKNYQIVSKITPVELLEIHALWYGLLWYCKFQSKVSEKLVSFICLLESFEKEEVQLLQMLGTCKWPLST